MSEEELALFDLLQKPEISKADRERVKQASQSLLSSIRKLLAPLERWTELPPVTLITTRPKPSCTGSCAARAWPDWLGFCR